MPYVSLCPLEDRTSGGNSSKLRCECECGHCLYSFCMCPGGMVVASSSEEGTVVTNGMSNYKRDGKNANSALLINVTPP